MNKPKELEPGQVWMGDKDFPYQGSYEGEFAYILCSIEPDDDCWVVAQFQEWTYGAQITKIFQEKDIRLMKYIGHIKELRESKKINNSETELY